MGFYDRFRQRKQGETVTPKQLGFQLMRRAAESAFDGRNSLDARIRGLDTRISTPPWEYNVELLIFAAFPYDVLIMTSSGSEAGRSERRYSRALGSS